ncbi:MAG: hypothetical protein ACXVEF_22640 [Polyangiales bacterium]
MRASIAKPPMPARGSTASFPRFRVSAALLLGATIAVGGVVGCEKDPGPPQVPAYLFDSRVPLEGELEKLKKAGEDPNKVLRPLSALELSKQIEPGKSYAFVVLPNGGLVLAPKPDMPAWSQAHPVLASGQAVKAAGHLRMEKSGDTITKLTIDGDSDTYCPTSDAMRSALATLVQMKVPSETLRIDNRPPDCFGAKKAPAASASAVPHPSFGTVMLSVARRFEVIGRAHKAKRNDLALYQLEELEETFRNEIPYTALPPLPPGVSIAPFLESMTSFNVPNLRKALESKDPKEIAGAYESMAKTCNGCHAAAKREFVEVPSIPGELVPRLDPKP